jgi:hypothetical protein
MQFKVIFKSCDGAGTYEDRFDTKEAAIQFADSRQAYSDSHGNPYYYTYTVYQAGREGAIYRTEPANTAITW